MLKKLLITFFIISLTAEAQHTIKGAMQPAKNYEWVALYQLKGARQDYITNAVVTDGAFSLTIPKEKEAGVYRIIYDLQNRLFVDFIYNNEDVSVNFHPNFPDKIIKFQQSYENNIYQNYRKAIKEPQQSLDSIQVAYFSANDSILREKLSADYQKNLTNFNAVQKQYEQLSMGKLANHFIKASKQFYAEQLILTAPDYLESIKNHFFEAIDFSSPELLNSAFINDKINNYIFSVHSAAEKETAQLLQKKNISSVLEKINTNQQLKKDIEEGLIYTFAQQEDIVMVNYLLNYYLQLPKELQDVPFINDIKGQLRTAIGMKAPPITWLENELEQDLYGLTGYTNYLIVFWSSTCSHCLVEMPLLYEAVKDNADLKVIAVGLEDEGSKSGWEAFIANYENFVHIYGDGKWENTFVRDYGVNATPSFFVLDADKKIISKPDDVAALKL